MTALERIQAFIRDYPGADILQDFQVDFTDQIPANGGLLPSGLVEVSRKTDLLGNVTVTNQYNFGLYCVFAKAAGDSEGAEVNAQWVLGFQEWVQAQSVLGLAPAFGDDPRAEKITAQNGALFDTAEGLGMYLIQLSVQFIKRFPTTDPRFR